LKLLLGEVYLREGNIHGRNSSSHPHWRPVPILSPSRWLREKSPTPTRRSWLSPIRNLLGALYTVAGAWDDAGPLLVDAL